jgi:RNA polymerase sigma factor (sigma-70 family)
MIGPASEDVLRPLGQLFGPGTLIGLRDAQLLERFATGGDEAAFAALVVRHGPMVLSLCRGVLRDEHAAEDAFQATFLVLARKAHSLWVGESLGGWLRRVGLRVAREAGRREARRRGLLRDDRNLDRLPGAAPIEADDRLAVLLEELGRLPEKYRAPIELCELEGLTRDEAARRLGWPPGTVAGRLVRARDHLRDRLVRRGIAGSLAAALAAAREAPASVSVPDPLRRATAALISSQRGGRDIPAAIATLAAGASTMMLRGRMMMGLAAASTLLALGLAAALALAPPSGARDEPAPGAQGQSGKDAIQADRKATQTLHLRVIDQDGRGVPDAPVEAIGDVSSAITVRTNAEGRAQATVDAANSQLELRTRPDDHSLGWAQWAEYHRVGPNGSAEHPITLTVLPLDRQIEGTIVDPKGQPIAGVLVGISGLTHPANGAIAARQTREEASSLGSSVTDEDGRYRLQIPKGATAGFHAYHPYFVGPFFGCQEEGDLIPPVAMAKAGRIVGVVTDAATGEPVANARVGAQLLDHSPGQILGGNYGAATSDAEGRFEVGSLAPGVYNLLFWTAPGGQHLTARAVEGVRVEAGQDARADLQLLAGRRLQGVVVDGETGKPLAGVRVSYYRTSHPQSGAACQGVGADEQGRFEGYVPPGPVFIYVASIPNPGEGSRRRLVVSEDHDPDPIELRVGGGGPPGQGMVLLKGAQRPAVPMAGRPPVPEFGRGDRTVTGHVKDVDGRPVPGLEVVFPSSQRVIVATDREGTFILKGLPAGELPLRLSRWGDQRSQATTIPAGSDEIDLTFPIPPQAEDEQ